MKFLLIALALLLPVFALASNADGCKTSITMNMSAEKWLVIDKVNVTVDVNAAAKADQVSALKTEIMSTLSDLSPKTDWHMVAMQQKQDSSGLMSLSISAVASVATDELSAIYSQVQNASKSGMKMSVSKVEYAPSADEVHAFQKELRAQIYAQSTAEAAALNKIYSDVFAVQNVYFNSYPQVKPYMLMGERAAVRDVQANVSNSQKLNQTARVTFAAGCTQRD